MNPGADPGSTPVLHVVAPAPYGGAESVIRLLVRAQRDAGYAVRVAAVVQPGEERRHGFVGALEEDGTEVVGLGVHPRAYLRERRMFGALCQQFRPSIVHAHGARVVVVDAPVARRVGARLVSTVHGMTGGPLRHRLYERIMATSLRRYDAIVAVSESVAEALRARGVPAPKVTIIPNAWEPTKVLLSRVEARRRLALDEHGFGIGWVGRFVPEKGADVIANALRQLDAPGWQAVLIGDGPGWVTVRRLLMSSGLGDVVRMPGALADASQLFAAFDVLVLSSRTEGTPMVLLEAVATGVPIVATAVGGIPDVLGPDAGILVPPEESQALARAIQLVRTDPAGAATRAETARARLKEHYGTDAWCESYSRVYRLVLEPERRRSPETSSLSSGA